MSQNFLLNQPNRIGWDQPWSADLRPISGERPHSNGCWILRWWISLHRSWTSEVMLHLHRDPQSIWQSWRNWRFIICFIRSRYFSSVAQKQHSNKFKWDEMLKFLSSKNHNRILTKAKSQGTPGVFARNPGPGISDILRCQMRGAFQIHLFAAWWSKLTPSKTRFCWGMMAAEAEWDTYYSNAAYDVYLCTLPRKGRGRWWVPRPGMPIERALLCLGWKLMACWLVYSECLEKVKLHFLCWMCLACIFSECQQFEVKLPCAD